MASGLGRVPVFSERQFRDTSEQHVGKVIEITHKDQTKLTGVLTGPYIGNSPDFFPAYYVERLKVEGGKVVVGTLHLLPGKLIERIRILGNNLGLWIQSEPRASEIIAEQLRLYPTDEALFDQINRGEYNFGEESQPAQSRVQSSAAKADWCFP